MGLVLTLFTSFEPLLSAKNFCASRKPHSATGLPVSINPSLSSGVVWLWGQGRSHGKGQRTSTDWGGGQHSGTKNAGGEKEGEANLV